jgi:hypothetical protein
MDNFTGHLMTFVKKDDSGDANVDEEVLVEITNMRNDGTVELAFDDRGERCYLRVPLGEIVNRVLLARGEEP